MKPGDCWNAARYGRKAWTRAALYHLITAEDSHDRMPNNGGRLADFEIQTIANWIRGGAKFDGQNPAAPLRDQIPRDIPHPTAPETYPATIPITAMTFTPDGKQLLVGGYHELLVWDPTSATLVCTHRQHSTANVWLGLQIRTVPGSRSLAVRLAFRARCGLSRGARSKERRRIQGFGNERGRFFDVAFRPDGKHLRLAQQMVRFTCSICRLEPSD